MQQMLQANFIEVEVSINHIKRIMYQPKVDVINKSQPAIVQICLPSVA